MNLFGNLLPEKVGDAAQREEDQQDRTEHGQPVLEPKPVHQGIGDRTNDHRDDHRSKDQDPQTGEFHRPLGEEIGADQDDRRGEHRGQR